MIRRGIWIARPAFSPFNTSTSSAPKCKPVTHITISLSKQPKQVLEDIAPHFHGQGENKFTEVGWCGVRHRSRAAAMRPLPEAKETQYCAAGIKAQSLARNISG